MGVKHFCIGWDVRILADWWDTKGAEMRGLVRRQGRAGSRQAGRRSRATTALSQPPVAPRRPASVHAARRHGRRRLCLAEGSRTGRRCCATRRCSQPDIRAYLEAENRYAEAILAPTDGAAEDAGRARCAAASRRTIPACRCRTGRSPICWKYREGGQHELIGRPPRDGGDFQTILDGDALAKASDYFKFGGRRHSPDHRLEAWSADLRGSEYFTIRVRRWDTGEDLPDTTDPDRRQRGVGRAIRRSSSMSGSTTIIGRCKVFRHRLGTPQSRRRAGLRGEGRRLVHPYRAKAPAAGSASSPAAITIRRSSGCSISPMPDATPRLIAPRETGVRYSVDDRGDELFILTNADGAIDFRIATAPLATPDRAHWRELIPHRPGVYILSTSSSTPAIWCGWSGRTPCPRS